MDTPRICVAGLDVASDKHLRPVADGGAQLTRALLAESGGLLELGAVIELGGTQPCPDRPEVEDVEFDPDEAERTERLEEDDYLRLIDRVSEDSLEDAFGPDLRRRGWKYAVDVGEGECSLGCVRAQQVPDLEINERYGERLQLRFNDADPPAYVPVNDLRFYEDDHKTLKHPVVEDVRDRLEDEITVWVMFGLARAFLAKGDDAERHWLQVNGLCLEDSPLGAVP